MRSWPRGCGYVAAWLAAHLTSALTQTANWGSGCGRRFPSRPRPLAGTRIHRPQLENALRMKRSTRRTSAAARSRQTPSLRGNCKMPSTGDRCGLKYRRSRQHPSRMRWRRRPVAWQDPLPWTGWSRPLEGPARWRRWAHRPRPRLAADRMEAACAYCAHAPAHARGSHPGRDSQCSTMRGHDGRGLE